MTNTELLNEKIKSSGLKKSYIANMLGISAQALYSKIQNLSEFTSSEIMSLAKLLNISSLEEKEKIFFAIGVDNKSTL